MLGVGNLLKAGRPTSQLPRKRATTQRRASRSPSPLPRGRAASRRRTGRLPSRPSRGGGAASAPAPPPPSPPLGARADPLVLRRPLPLPLLAVTKESSNSRACLSASIVGTRGPAWSGCHKEEHVYPNICIIRHFQLSWLLNSPIRVCTTTTADS